jgi:hypothetical protein
MLAERVYMYAKETDKMHSEESVNLEGAILRIFSACMSENNSPSMALTTSFDLATSLQFFPWQSLRESSISSCSSKRLTISTRPSEAAR